MESDLADKIRKTAETDTQYQKLVHDVKGRGPSIFARRQFTSWQRCQVVCSKGRELMTAVAQGNT